MGLPSRARLPGLPFSQEVNAKLVYPAIVAFAVVVAGYLALTITGHPTGQYMTDFVAPVFSLLSSVVAGVAVYHTTQTKNTIMNEVQPLLQDVHVKVNGNLEKLIEKVGTQVIQDVEGQNAVANPRQNVPGS